MTLILSKLLRCVVVTSISVLTPLAAVVAEQTWQLNVAYDQTKVRIVSASPVMAKKKVTHPGLLNAIETEHVVVRWFGGGKEVFASTGELPFGNRFAHSCPAAHSNCMTPASGASVLRVIGPDQSLGIERIEMNFIGTARRFGVKLEADQTGTSRSDIVFDIPLMAKATSALPGAPGPQGVTTLRSTGANDNRFVLVVLGDGFLSSDISGGYYAQSAETILDYLASQSPWDSLLDVTNIFLVNVESSQSGADDPSIPTTVDTYFNASFGNFGIDRLLALDSTGKERAYAAADDYVGAGVWDSIIVMVNSSKYGGSGGDIAVMSLNEFAPDVAVHELGHSIANLADEYEDAYPGYPEFITEPNVDENGTDPKWSAWLTDDVPLPTPDVPAYEESVGSFEGARYKSTGVYRPMSSCKMRVVGVPFCPVCKEALVKAVTDNAKLYDAVTPENRNVKIGRSGKRFSATVFPFKNVTKKWSLCGKAFKSGVSQVTVKKANLNKNKSCRLTLTLKLTTDLVRARVKKASTSWTVSK